MLRPEQGSTPTALQLEYTEEWCSRISNHICHDRLLHSRVPRQPSQTCQGPGCQPVTTRIYHNPAIRGTVDLRRSPLCESQIALVETNLNSHHSLDTATKTRLELTTFALTCVSEERLKQSTLIGILARLILASIANADAQT